MKGNPTHTKSDLLTRHASLRTRIKDLLDGVTPMHFYVGAFGLNTTWARLHPAVGWHYPSEESYVRWRLRSDVVYLDTVRAGGLTPVSGEGWPKTPALYLPSKPNVSWPSYRVSLYSDTTEGGISVVKVMSDGRVFFAKPSEGRVLQPGISWPRG